MARKFRDLTRKNIRALRPGERITEQGITAEGMKNGDIRYSINIMVEGERIHRVLGRDSGRFTPERAADAIETYRTKARAGTLDLPTGRKHHRTFTEGANEYLTRIKGQPKHGKNLPRKTRHIEDKLAPFFKTLRLDKLDDTAIAEFVDERLGQGASEATVNRELSTLSHFLNRAVDWKWLRSKPRIDKFEEERKQIETLTAPERSALMTAAIQDQDPQTWLFVVVAIGTGMRHSEILRVKWEHISTDSQRIHIPTAKAGMREQPIPSKLADMLAEEWRKRGRPKGYLFPTTRADAKHPHRSTMSKQFARAAERAGLDTSRVTPHILRHTAITDLVRAGVDLPTIQKISGHKTLAMVLRYTQLVDSHVDDSLSALNANFAGTVTPELHTPGNVASLDEARDRQKA